MTREEVEKLTDKELRVKAAELTGWTEIRVLSGMSHLAVAEIGG